MKLNLTLGLPHLGDQMLSRQGPALLKLKTLGCTVIVNMSKLTAA